MHDMGPLILVGAIFAVGYLLSLRLHPHRRCRACNGTGRHFGSVYRNSHRLCASCGGNGRRARLGIHVFHRGALVWGEGAPARTAERRGRNLGR
jgi:hypothetical protein